MLSADLEEADPTVYDIIQKASLPLHFAPNPTVMRSATDCLQEKRRQKHFINLIPSENFTSQAVLDALGSVMQSEHIQHASPATMTD